MISLGLVKNRLKVCCFKCLKNRVLKHKIKILLKKNQKSLVVFKNGSIFAAANGETSSCKVSKVH
ncbi:hypothetical protein IX49_03085 [Cellulophaga lytica]|nr:hypothetical protein IX49_03085 [Cellulophaga lytica]